MRFLPGAPEEGVASPGTGVNDGCVPQCGCWEENGGLWESKCP